jgi:2-desacetyl-2-hydroxyethyl bacteriochlorophyllide A dehydrogenase
VLVAVEAAGICGSDVQGVATRSPRRTPPLIMGHELAGAVVAVGTGAPTSLHGRRVAVNPQIPCGLCHACRSGRENVCQHRGLVGGDRPGGFSELVSIPARCVHVLPEGLEPDVAVLAEPLATCVHGAELLSRIAPRSAIVLGAGTIGVLAAHMLRVIGTTWVAVTDVAEERRSAMSHLVDAAVAPEAIGALARALPGGGAEVTVDAVGSSSTRRDSLRMLQPLGTALWLGMHDQESAVPAFEVVVREQRVQGSFAYTNAEFARAVELLGSGQITPSLATRSFPLDEGARAFQDLLDGTPAGFLKSIIAPPSAPAT